MAEVSCALVVLAKSPMPGRVKTRMSPPLTDDECAHVHEAMMRDVFALGRRFEHRLAFRAGDAHPVWDDAVRSGWRVQDQRGADLGARIQQAVDEGLSLADRVIVLGSDSPHLQEADLHAACAGLDDADACVAPAEDGGYRMIALRGRSEALFANVTWGTPAVMDETRAAARAAGLVLSELPEGFDLDTVADLARLRIHSKGAAAAHTLAALAPLASKLSPTTVSP